MSIGPEFIAENMGYWLNLPVLIERNRSDETELIPGVVSSIDPGKGKVLIRGLIEGVEYAAPLELLRSGRAWSRKGHLRYSLLPQSRGFVSDRGSGSLIPGNLWVE
ncbi:hypothetical protein A3H85_00875 [Candidatus Daviesbacteria bacterium RIFCSPLOWO2_02_FULL_40_8]|uniref:Uncharacterized protein n=1 Tax=Candidatus Daviesbacteria bacterium RIFCSPLOWO2_01_FULL_40_24 TaxID=1797787 RepID=A0A1F5MIQ5_9BACT|nr:MAG: hypothetical protein A2780_02950 [Candidatus Daviesbacteria bacterium RIFCSPHIGHO2_01_FULL_41_45]OGE34087.1 MAG: hypothetical protein A3C32_00130 [Candidatus Daviesbacteria bacterium RIFCSPHIGHO2_02_FULL_41_14]OGE65242.1 MAG: hypothetical protein A3B49_02325 [Candidatus Daviesbacteria bacterium RIFCSPLOWO2_01_FULL_40_24]OGE66792.1 MAG: hypothetical protein A3H85_00875 [Candidatus Daviesbacteria bacterium RIFCSPLOWO2_02_FULL_40_8]